MGIKSPVEPRPKSPLLLYDYSGSPNLIMTRRQPFLNQRASLRSKLASPCPSLNNESSPLSFLSSVSSPIRVQSAPSAGMGPLRNSSRLWTPHSMIEPIFLPSSSAHRSGSDHLVHANLAFVFDEARKFGNGKVALSLNSSVLSVNSDDHIMRKLDLSQSVYAPQREKSHATSQTKYRRNGFPTLNPSTRSEMEFKR